MSASKGEIASLIVNYFSSIVEKKEISEDSADSLNVAMDCISEAFGFEREAVPSILEKSEFKGQNLTDLLNSTPRASESTKKDDAQNVEVNIPEEDAEIKAKAEDLKMQGNKAMANKDYELAINKYTEAIKVLPTNAIYYANRAAAHSSLKGYDEAVKDAESAISIDPSYFRGYSRLGFAKYAQGKPEEALEAYKKVLDIEGDNATEAMKRDYESAKKKVEQSLNLEKTVPEQSRDADANADASQGAGTSGLPDLGSLLGGGLGGLMNNPQLMQAAQKMMSNPGAMQNIQKMMQDPNIKQMAEGFTSGGGAPNLSDLMNNPALRSMAGNLFGGAGAPSTEDTSDSENKQ
ncbi:hypothetical protein SKDZ_15G1600 [Saccharomyces kudriavzevii ZP591]|uniref:Sgt2p n=1 Tax=Saccharomyces cerevisiae x Saccharomyces kudriavzevii (strain VIN7) TaxID=1095631 RepID=H0H0Y3_SACCK|nr:Sgt2p [Saccharomyces cerevisiae x Saccharomyces kudriavzevii VIN7]CAI4051207.1 hypothetical protein SKDZ_15G1600 [Saccharomyces kudriavzevii ZP591]